MPPTIVCGGHTFGNYDGFKTEDDAAKVFAILKKHGVKDIDSSQMYGGSEAFLGKYHAGDQFTLDTKWGMAGGFEDKSLVWATKEFIIESAKKSIETLGVKQVDIFYLHFPDINTPVEVTMDGVDAVYRMGLFRRFGLSNFPLATIQRIHDYAKAKGYVLPTVYQDQYNPVVREPETDLFPTLRKLGISFYAYSPLAGGLLTKTVEEVVAGKNRFAKGGIYHQMFSRPAYLNSLAKWNAAARDEGVSAAELAYRWDVWHSILSEEYGDAVIVGTNSHSQLDETLGWVAKGKLSDKAVAAIQEVWEGIKADKLSNE